MHHARRLLEPVPTGTSEYKLVMDHLLDVIEDQGGAASASLLLATLREIRLYAEALTAALEALPEQDRLPVIVMGDRLVCPHCGSSEMNRIESTTRWWDTYEVTTNREPGRDDRPLIVVHTASDHVADEGDDAHWECRTCWSELADPAEDVADVDYEAIPTYWPSNQ